MVRSASLAIAIIAPVLPADTAASALPSFTALIAMPIEVVRARRIAWLGFSLGGDRFGRCGRSSTPDLQVGVRLQLGADQLLVADRTRNCERRIAAARARGAGEHRRRAAVAPHGVNRDARGLRPSASAPAPRCSGLGRDDLAAVIVAAGGAQVVRQLELAAVRAFLEARRASAHDGCGACCASRARFFFWGQPLRHLLQ